MLRNFIIKNQNNQFTGEYAEEFKKLFEIQLGRSISLSLTSSLLSETGFFIKGYVQLQLMNFFYKNSENSKILIGIKNFYADKFCTFENDFSISPFNLPNKSICKKIEINELNQLLPLSLPFTFDIDLSKYFVIKSVSKKFKYPESSNPASEFQNKLIDFLDLNISTSAESVLFKYFFENYAELYLSGTTEKNPLIDYIAENIKNENKKIEIEVKKKIIERISFSLTGLIDSKISKKGVEDYEKYYHGKRCDHQEANILQILPELKLNDNFYECEHGNTFCIHEVEYEKLEQSNLAESDILDYMSKYGEVIDLITVCKLCGAKLSFSADNIFYSTSRYEETDEEKKLLYRDVIFAFSGLRFKNLKTEFWKKKFISQITNELYPKINTQIKKVQKKNINEDHYIAHLKIINLLFTYGFFIGFVNKNTIEARFREGKFDDTYNNIFHNGRDLFKTAADIYLNKIKDYSSININSNLQTIIDILSFYKIEKEQTEQPKSTVEALDGSDLAKFIKNFGIISHPVKSKIRKEKNEFEISLIFDPRLKEFLDKMSGDESAPIFYKRIIFSRKLFPQDSYDLNYISYLKGVKNNIHDHIWNEILIDGKPKNLANVELNESGKILVCGLCGLTQDNYYDEILPKIEIDFIKNEKLIFFENFCPEKIKHEIKNKICIYCGYPSNNFLKKYNIIKFKPKQKLTEVIYKKIQKFDVSVEKPKIVNSSIKKVEYEIFWNNIGLYELYEYKDLLKKKYSDIDITKLIFIYYYLRLWIRKSINFVANNLPDPLNKKMKLIEISSKMPEVSCLNKPEEIKSLIICFFNELPNKQAEDFFAKLVLLHRTGAKTPDNISAKNLVGAIDNEGNDYAFLDGEDMLDADNDFNDDQVDFDEELKNNLQVE